MFYGKVKNKVKVGYIQALIDQNFSKDNKQEKLDYFLKLQSFLLSNESQELMEKLGKRTWYGGIKENADPASFKKEWGIDTSKYLNSLKYPSKVVMDKALNLYDKLGERVGNYIGISDNHLYQRLGYIFKIKI